MKQIEFSTPSDLAQSSIDQCFIEIGKHNLQTPEYIVLRCSKDDENMAYIINKVITKGYLFISRLIIIIDYYNKIPKNKWKLIGMSNDEKIFEIFGAGIF